MSDRTIILTGLSTNSVLIADANTSSLDDVVLRTGDKVATLKSSDKEMAVGEIFEISSCLLIVRISATFYRIFWNIGFRTQELTVEGL